MSVDPTQDPRSDLWKARVAMVGDEASILKHARMAPEDLQKASINANFKRSELQEKLKNAKADLARAQGGIKSADIMIEEVESTYRSDLARIQQKREKQLGIAHRKKSAAESNLHHYEKIKEEAKSSLEERLAALKRENAKLKVLLGKRKLSSVSEDEDDNEDDDESSSKKVKSNDMEVKKVLDMGA
ncbi:MAG: hypothetical protein SGILL_007164 [Bacillariaceae sp.]